MTEKSPHEWTVDFENDGVTITDDGRRGKPVPLWREGELSLETLLALSWYVAATEEECEVRLLQVLGRYLFELIFPTREDGKVEAELTERRARFKTQCETARGVRLNLHFAKSAARYAQLPWEFLRVETQNDHRFLADLEDVTVTLTRFLPTQTELRVSDPPIRVLVHVSEPPDKSQISYDSLEAELKKLSERAGGKLELRFRRDAPLKEIRDELEEYKPHVFHFSGHGEHDGFWLANGNRDEARKALEKIGMSRQPFGFHKSVDTEVFKASIDAICSLFRAHKPRLIVLDACTSDWSWLSEMLPGVAHQLVTQVPAVVAMRYPISNGAAEAFSLALYRGIVEGRPLDKVVQTARNELKPVEPAEYRAFGTPVLYLKGAAALCDPLLEVEETPGLRPDRRPAQAKPCPRCRIPGLLTATAGRCTTCGIYFRCRNKDCETSYLPEQIAQLHFCCNCEEKYQDLWPWPRPDEPGPPTAPAVQPRLPVGVAPSGLVPQQMADRNDLAQPEQFGFAPSSAGQGASKLTQAPADFDARLDRGTDEAAQS
jgi:hypothetical protein